MKQFSLRISDELHDKLRWLSYKQRKSIHEILIELIEREFKDVQVPEEAKR